MSNRRTHTNRALAALAALLALWVTAVPTPLVAAQPGARLAAQPGEEPPAEDQAEMLADVVNGDDPTVRFGETAEPMDLTALVDFVAETLGINVSVRGELKGSVLFNVAREVPVSQLLPLLDALLEQHDYSITFDRQSGFYLIQPEANIPRTFDADGLASTKLIEVPTIKPSSLSEAITQILGGQGTVSYVDELGLIILTDTPRQIRRVEELINRILDRLNKMTLTPIELRFISAPAARDRLISLAGGAAADPTGGLARQIRRGGEAAQQPGIGPAAGGTIENIAERLAVDPQSNALLFRGTADELERVLDYVSMIDVPNTLQARRHFVGTAARQLADIARRRGLGEVIVLDDAQQQGQFGFQRQFQQPGQMFDQDQEVVAGPTLVVDVRNGEIVYYGTESQQEELAALIDTLDTEADRVVIRQYRLNHADAESVADVITALLTGDTGVAQGGLLPQSRGQLNQFQQQPLPIPGGGGGDDEIGEFDPTRVFVVPDPANNQIVVKAPLKQQEDFAQLIERLDLRRRQVYIEATIVAVSDTNNFRLAVETQFSAGQFQTQTNFGLSEAGEGFTDPRSPLTDLAGLTSALIKSQYVPIIINALENETDARILSRPQLLVNDNEEATIASVEQQPTTSISQGGDTTVTSFQGFEDAGTTLTVTPSISEAGFLRLLYEIEFSNFIGTGGSDGIPPPKQERTVVGNVTMPTDATIVVGGITVEDARNTVVKVPLLGDIPIIGLAFSDINKVKSNSLLYIFITPRIIVDPDFRDLRLLTRGPQFEAGVELDLPPLEPIAIDRIPRPRRENQD